MNSKPASATDPDVLRLPFLGSEVFYTREGSKEGLPILCVHGIPGSVRDFRYLAPELVERGFQVIRVDMPGFGLTPREVWPHTRVEERGAFLLEFLRALDIHEFGLLAHSAGGGPAFMASEEAGSRLKLLLLVNSIGVVRNIGMGLPEPFLKVLRRGLVSPLTHAAILDRMKGHYRRMGIRNKKLRDDDYIFHLDLVLGLDFAHHRRAIRSVQAPVALFSSADDKLVQPRCSRSLQEAFRPNAIVRHVQFHQGGHYLQKHKAPEIAEHAQEVLALP